MVGNSTRRACLKSAIAALVGAAGPPFAGAARAEATRLAFQTIWLNDPEFSGYFLAIDKGYYAQENLSIDYLPGGPDVIPQASLLTGKADIALLSLIETARAIVEKGADFRIIGTQFQRSPDSVISMESSGIRNIRDLAGRTVACPALNIEPFRLLLDINDVPQEKVRIVPYSFDPTPLTSGQVDAVVDFMTSLPFIIEQTSGRKASYILFSQAGITLGEDLVTVTTQTLRSRRREIVAFLRASRKGWAEDFRDPDKYAQEFQQSWFMGNGYTPEALLYHSRNQIPLMQSPTGVFSMSDDWIDSNVASLGKLGIKVPRDVFDASLLAEI